MSKISISPDKARDVLRSSAINVTEEDIEQTIQVLRSATPTTSWWTILLKVIAYAIGLILAGVGTVACTRPFF